MSQQVDIERALRFQYGGNVDVGQFVPQSNYTAFVRTISSGGSQRGLMVVGYPTDTAAGARQSVLGVSMTRETALATWDGNGDIAFRIWNYNEAANGSNGGIRAAEILARNTGASATLNWISGAYVTAENKTGAGTVAGDIVGLEVHAKNDAVCSGNVKCVRIYDESQSSTGTSYALEISCTNDSAFTREYCIYINSGASSGWTNGITFDGNITNVFNFVDSATNGATEVTGQTASGNQCKIKFTCNSNTYYLLGSATIS